MTPPPQPVTDLIFRAYEKLEPFRSLATITVLSTGEKKKDQDTQWPRVSLEPQYHHSQLAEGLSSKPPIDTPHLRSLQKQLKFTLKSLVEQGRELPNRGGSQTFTALAQKQPSPPADAPKRENGPFLRLDSLGLFFHWWLSCLLPKQLLSEYQSHPKNTTVNGKNHSSVRVMQHSSENLYLWQCRPAGYRCYRSSLRGEGN